MGKGGDNSSQKDVSDVKAASGAAFEGSSGGESPTKKHMGATENDAGRRQKEREKAPEEQANIISLLTFWWLQPLISKGYRQVLELADLPLLPISDTSDYISIRYKQALAQVGSSTAVERPTGSGKGNNKEENKSASASGGPVYRALLLTFWPTFLLGGVFRLTSDILMLLSPIFYNSTLQFIQNDKSTSNFMYKVFGKNYGWYSAAALLVVPTIRSLVENQYFQSMFRLGIQVKTALLVMVYDKTLRLSNSARQGKSVGEIVTLMQVDTDKVSMTTPFIHTAWSGIVQILGYTALLIYYIGWPALTGLALLLITLPTQGRIVNRMLAMQRRILLNTGKRVKVVNEVLQGIKVVKAYAWERPFKAAIGEVRYRELQAMTKRVYLRALQMAIMLASPAFIMVITFTFYSAVAHKSLNASTVFTAIALFGSLRMPLIMYPFVINSILAGHVSIRRLATFMGLEDLKAVRDFHTVDGKDDGGDAPVVQVTNAYFKWSTAPKPKDNGLGKGPGTGGGGLPGMRPSQGPASKEATKKIWSNTGTAPAKDVAVPLPNGQQKAEDAEEIVPFGLKEIDFKVNRGQLIAIVGPVGSGKSSLASALLGEMDQISGASVVIKGSLGYCAQQAWIMNATLKENVLFGREMESERYQRVIHACALDQDLELLPDGDMTEIGERGINLSGGQKQRVSLARAVYSDADIYLLDDPLSAVDAHVGAHLFSNCITGMLAGKTRIFITNQLQFVQAANSILVLKDGEVVQKGTYEELMADESEFAALMKASGADSNSVQQDGDGAEKGERGGKRSRRTSRSISAVNPRIEKLIDKLGGGVEQAAKKEKGAGEQKTTEKGQLVEQEGRARGMLKLKVYKKYFTEASVFVTLGVVLLFCAVQALDAYQQFWLSYWTQDKYNESTGFYLGIYAGLAALYGILTYLRSLGLYLLGLWTSRVLHQGLVASVLRCPMSFFDTTPVGRILNRFSNDMSYVDENLPMSWSMFLVSLFAVLGGFVVITIVTWWFVLVLVPVAALYFYVQQWYRKTARELKRLDAISKSPIYSQFTETLNGLATIRAYGQVARFLSANHAKVDVNNRAYFYLRCCDRWLSVRLELMGNTMVCSAAMFAVANRHSLYAGLAGISINYALQVTNMLSMLVRQMTDTENQMNAVERIHEYRDTLTREAPEVVDDYRPPPNWPSKGDIQITNLSMRYRSQLPLVLKNVSLNVVGGEKVGVVGRTGSGKSSLMLCLFRLVEPAEGSIVIDGLDTLRMGLEDLRSRISIIPQDPVLFSGTVRSNLDPFSNYTDEQLWTALEKSHLKEKISNLGGKLEAEVVEYGENFSVGERQLLCLARVLLRDSRILVCDEATSSVDFDTDRLIQTTIRTHLTHTTMLIIAHRINTVIDSSRVLLMEDGEVAEYDTPAALLDKPGGKFAALVAATGDDSAEHLRKVARGEEDYFALYNRLKSSLSSASLNRLARSPSAGSLRSADESEQSTPVPGSPINDLSKGPPESGAPGAWSARVAAPLSKRSLETIVSGLGLGEDKKG